MITMNVGEITERVDSKTEVVGYYIPAILIQILFVPMDRTLTNVRHEIADFYEELTG